MVDGYWDFVLSACYLNVGCQIYGTIETLGVIGIDLKLPCLPRWDPQRVIIGMRGGSSTRCVTSKIWFSKPLIDIQFVSFESPINWILIHALPVFVLVVYACAVRTLKVFDNTCSSL